MLYICITYYSTLVKCSVIHTSKLPQDLSFLHLKLEIGVELHASLKGLGTLPDFDHCTIRKKTHSLYLTLIIKIALKRKHHKPSQHTNLRPPRSLLPSSSFIEKPNHNQKLTSTLPLEASNSRSPFSFTP